MYNSENELFHYGVKGMKWGVRKKTYSDAEISNYRKKKIAKAEKDYKKYSKKLKSGSSMAIVGLALENHGLKKLSDIMYSKSDKRYKEWERKANEALFVLKNKKVSSL